MLRWAASSGRNTHRRKPCFHAISDSYATGNMTVLEPLSYIGGLAGSNTQGTIINGHVNGYYYRGDCRAPIPLAGGLVRARTRAPSETSFATGALSVNGDVGGLVGSSTFHYPAELGLPVPSPGSGSVGGLAGSSSWPHPKRALPRVLLAANGSTAAGWHSGWWELRRHRNELRHRLCLIDYGAPVLPDRRLVGFDRSGRHPFR